MDDNSAETFVYCKTSLDKGSQEIVGAQVVSGWERAFGVPFKKSNRQRKSRSTDLMCVDIVGAGVYSRGPQSQFKATLSHTEVHHGFGGLGRCWATPARFTHKDY